MDEQEKQGQSAQPEQAGSISTIEANLIKGQVEDALRTCYDPEIPVNILDLGLIYDIRVSLDGGVLVVMTLTSPHCPAVQSLPQEIEAKIRTIPGVTAVKATVTWDPPWNMSLMTEAARLELGM
jgi:FeS assembly SUF system protein